MTPSERRFRSLALATAQIVWTTDPNGQVLDDSPSWRAFTGQTYEQWRGWGWLDALHPDDRDRSAATWRKAVEERGLYEVEYRVRTTEGDYRWTAARGVPVLDDDGRIIEWVGTNTDITEKKRVEADLRDADRRKDEFLATLAHELRNPLAPICNSLELLRLGGDAETSQQCLGIMQRQVNQMVRLVDDLLDLSRISRGRVDLQKERVDLASVLESAIETSKPLIDEAGHDLRVTIATGPLVVEGDVVRLAQVFANLLNNAAKYTEPGGQISVAAERQENDVVVAVRDNGVGIPAATLPHIFDMFTQAASSRGKSQGGLGIGLTLVQRLLEMHGGSIVARSNGLDQGSEFVVRLPVVNEAMQGRTAGVKASIAKPRGGRRILVVDDNRDSALTLARMLGLMGNEMEVAHDGVEALEVADRFFPEIVLLDIGMPRMNGYDACRELRQRPWGDSLVIAALTGWGQENDRQRTHAAGFDYHLVKPVTLDDLNPVLGAQKILREGTLS